MTEEPRPECIGFSDKVAEGTKLFKGLNDVPAPPLPPPWLAPPDLDGVPPEKEPLPVAAIAAAAGLGGLLLWALSRREQEG